MRRDRVLLGSLGGTACVALWIAVEPSRVLHDWLVPPLVLLLAYWTSGALYSAPSPAWERRLINFDNLLGIRSWSERMPRALSEFLEVSYAWVYPLIPVALAVHLTLTPDADADRFWTIVLITDFICFGMLPWIPTRPPRALEGGVPWRATFRRVNARVLGTASIGANTFPSGHAAEALAAALLVIGAPPVVMVWMFFNAAAIAAGAVFGRYHYAADAIAGFAVAAAVWAAF